MGSALLLTQFSNKGLDLFCCVNTSDLLDHLAVFLEEKGWNRHDTKGTSCVWIFINVHFDDFQDIF